MVLILSKILVIVSPAFAIKSPAYVNSVNLYPGAEPCSNLAI
jgi:hypothetical protein